MLFRRVWILQKEIWERVLGENFSWELAIDCLCFKVKEQKSFYFEIQLIMDELDFFLFYIKYPITYQPLLALSPLILQTIQIVLSIKTGTIQLISIISDIYSSILLLMTYPLSSVLSFPHVLPFSKVIFWNWWDTQHDG